jgi:hypothetical protein
MPLIQRLYKYVLHTCHVNMMRFSGLLDKYTILTYWIYIVNEHRIENQQFIKAASSF